MVGHHRISPNNLAYAKKLIRMNYKSQIYIFETIFIRDFLFIHCLKQQFRLELIPEG